MPAECLQLHSVAAYKDPNGSLQHLELKPQEFEATCSV